jgi:two-component system nitrogen regulation response regulator GlnG
VRVDVRIIAATHQNLEQRVAVQTFRQDLYHRLNVIRIQLPSLAQRREDIPALLTHFLARIGVELGVGPKLLLPETAAYLAGLEWPGNVRQLENTCRWLTVMAVGRELRIDDLPPELQAGDGGRAATVAANREWQSSLRRWVDCELGAGRQNLHEAVLPIVERIMIETALEHSSGNRGAAAVLLGWGRNTLPRKIKQFATLAR